ncbi:MAB_1171c family putative transporter [Streptomyces rubiginosohelvolus]|uniref:MAB_1171c family putative transporter n=1 Tax=Streptomyces rubiginosohelvolus TaxID=67362 RepID=UPI0036D773A1
MNSLNLVAIVTLLGGAAWTIPALVRRRFHDPMRVHLFFALLLMGLGNVLAQPHVLGLADRVMFEGFAKITYNVAVLTGLSLMIGFLRERPLSSWTPPWPWEVGACAVCLAAMLAMTALLPASLRDHQLTSAFLADWRVRTFYNFGNFYLLFGYGAGAFLAGRHARRGNPLRRLSLSIMACGLAGLALTCVFRFLWVNLPSLREPGNTVTYAENFVFGQVAAIVVCVGLSLPFFTSVGQILRERRFCRRQFTGLEELWRRLVTAHPELVLDHRPRRTALFVDASAVYRRYVECRDGLTRLSPYLSAAPTTAATGSENELRAAARLIDRGVRLVAEDRRTAPGATAFVLAPQEGRASGVHDYEEDLSTLIRLSAELRALRSGPVARVE